MSKWDEMSERERDAWVAERVMGYVREPHIDPGANVAWFKPPEESSGRGTGTTILATTAPAFTTDAAADYLVLCRVRETWTSAKLREFGTRFHCITGMRAETGAQKAVFAVMYEPGDWSHAAYLALEGK